MPAQKEDSDNNKLQHSKALFRFLFEQSPFSIQIYSPQGWTLHVNKAWEKLFGVTLEMIQDYNILQDKQLLENGLMPYIERGFNGEPTTVPPLKYDVSVEVPGASHVRWVRAFIYPVKKDGLISEVILMHEDVTAQIEAENALREREKLLRTITNSLPALISYVGSDLHYKFCNQTYENWFEMDLDQIIGQHMEKVIGQRAFMAIEQRLHKALTGKAQSFETYLDYSDNTKRFVSVTLLPDHQQASQVDGIYVLVSDRTEYKKAEEAARRHHAELSHIARLNTASEMATGIAHEINQPLTTIKLLSRIGLQLLEADTIDTESLRSTLNDIGAQAIRAGDIIRSLRQLITNKPPRQDLLNLQQLIREATTFVETDTQRENVELSIDIDQTVPPVYADNIQIQQVFVNLILNAVRAIQEAGREQGHIVISATNIEDGRIAISVHDNGCGMDADTLKQAFDSFFSSGYSRGIGMGLSICRSTIERHGGTISADSVAGEGTTISFTLPVAHTDNNGTAH